MLQQSRSQPTRQQQPALSLHRRRRPHLRSLVRFLLLCSRLRSEFSLANRQDDEIWPFIRHYDFHLQQEPADLLFDLSLYRVNRHRRVPTEVAHVLRKEPANRSPAELFTAQVHLRSYKAIADYPVRMQALVAKAGLYESYEPRRIIIRQGHRALSFYFILSGTCTVMLMDRDQGYARPVAYLSRGQSFGELAIIERTIRQAYVISRDTVELLSIDIDSYHAIFMSSGQRSALDPDFEAFLDSLGYLEGFPRSLLKPRSDSTSVHFHFYKSDEVLARDTNYSDWIYFVKSGSLSVVKRFPLTRPTIRGRRGDDNGGRNADQSARAPDVAPADATGPAAQAHAVAAGGPGFQEYIRTIKDDFDAAYKLKRTPTDAWPRSQLVRVQTLLKGNAFGLSQLLHGPQTRFSLVSNGAECLMVDKRYFLAKCPKPVRQRLAREVSRYPTEEDFQRMLQTAVDWRQYRLDTLKATRETIQLEKAVRP